MAAVASTQASNSTEIKTTACSSPPATAEQAVKSHEAPVEQVPEVSAAEASGAKQPSESESKHDKESGVVVDEAKPAESDEKVEPELGSKRKAEESSEPVGEVDNGATPPKKAKVDEETSTDATSDVKCEAVKMEDLGEQKAAAANAADEVAADDDGQQGAEAPVES